MVVAVVAVVVVVAVVLLLLLLISCQVGDVLIGCVTCIDSTILQPKDKSRNTHW